MLHSGLDPDSILPTWCPKPNSNRFNLQIFLQSILPRTVAANAEPASHAQWVGGNVANKSPTPIQGGSIRLPLRSAIDVPEYVASYRLFEFSSGIILEYDIRWNGSIGFSDVAFGICNA